ncbi:MAG: hypothetical protein A2Z88_03095 [Omnitrophica WOR_2 bacterium GWA2_47_8]|nr:MAG: hypothetical protein A2Z88_03095 [Omnitrophica WOR_2 bacterium GWA2_47_8]
MKSEAKQALVKARVFSVYGLIFFVVIALQEFLLAGQGNFLDPGFVGMMGYIFIMIIYGFIMGALKAEEGLNVKKASASEIISLIGSFLLFAIFASKVFWKLWP